MHLKILLQTGSFPFGKTRSPFSNSFKALNNLTELYDYHSELEVVQLMINVFNLELKNYDPLALASKVRSIMHDIKATSV